MRDQEHKLIQDCIAGNARAQEQLYKLHANKMMAVCMRYARTREDAEDMLIEGFFKVFQDLHQFRFTGPLGAWIRRVMVNNCLMHIRKRSKLETAHVDDLTWIAEPSSSGDRIFATLSANELLGLVQQLPDGFKVVFNLYAIEGYKHQEIAQLLDISVGTSKSQLHKAKQYLRKLISDRAAAEQQAVRRRSNLNFWLLTPLLSLFS